jgi:salicylate hydroxylase
MRIAIIGAGIGGLTAALALQQRGFDVQVLEQASQLAEIGAGVQISPNGIRVLSALGLGAAIESVASEPLGKRVRLWNTGQTWNLFDLGSISRERYGFPYLTMHRGDLHRVLVEAVRAHRPDAITLGVRVDGLRREGGRTIVQSEGRDVADADFVIGADGVHSRVRQQLFGADQPRFSGIVAWRGVIEARALPEHLRQPYGCNWVGPGRHVIHYPMRGNTLVNLVAAVERQGARWEVESWSQRGTTEEFLADFEGWHADVQSLIRAVEVPYKWALMVREPMARWSEGGVTLLGDACHPTLPFLAQGAVMAIEDGYVLARCLAASPADLPAALAAYEGARIERTSRIVRGSAANAERFHNPELAHAAGAAAYVDREWSEERVKERYEWLFDYDAERVPL